MSSELMSILHLLKGAPASILLALLAEGQPLGVKILSRLTGWSDTKISEGLEKLEAVGFIERRARYNGWALTVRAARFSFQVGLSPTQPAPHTVRDGAGGDGEAAKPNDLASESEEADSLKNLELSSSDSAPSPANSGIGGDSQGRQANDDSDFWQRADVARILAATPDLFGEELLGGPARYPDARLLLATIAETYTQRARLRHPARVAYSNLARKQPPQARFLHDPLVYLPHDFLYRAGLAGPPPQPDEYDDLEQDDDPDEVEEPDEPSDPSILLPADRRGQLSAERAWQMAVELLRLDMPKAAVDRYLAPAFLQRFDPQPPRLIVAAPTAYARDWMTDRLTSTLRRMLIGICDQDVAVEFVALGEEEDEQT